MSLKNSSRMDLISREYGVEGDELRFLGIVDGF